MNIIPTHVKTIIKYGSMNYCFDSKVEAAYKCALVYGCSMNPMSYCRGVRKLWNGSMLNRAHLKIQTKNNFLTNNDNYG